MTFRDVGHMDTMISHTTAEIAAILAAYGPSGAVEANAIKPGVMFWNSTTAAIMVYNGTIFKTVTAT